MEGQRQPTALVLVNLGTPETCTPGGVRRFLRQFLSDRRVVEIPRPIWWLILNLFILPFRPKKVAEAYKVIWTERGSPLRYYTEDQVEKLQARFVQRYPGRTPTVRYAMTYGSPSIASVINELYESGHRRIVVLPMYPQYSCSTIAPIYDQIAEYCKGHRALPGLQIINGYFYESAYIHALAGSIRSYWDEHGQPEKLLFSYHGVPEFHGEKGYPYVGHCQCTTGATVKALGLAEDQYQMSFQSRFGKAEWVKPYTDATVEKLAKEGVRRLDVVCPAFAVDCLETIEEIGEQNREIFIEHGGEELRLIPCLNASDIHIDALEVITAKYLDAIV
ncbi:MAG: ferrochelatase [Gammaproteobacteria bacterium]